MIPSQMTLLTQLFYGRTLPSFAERTCVAIDGHVTSKLLNMLQVSYYTGQNLPTKKVK